MSAVLTAKGTSMSKSIWLRDALHDLKKFANDEGLRASEDALRIAIIRVCDEQDLPTKLSARELVQGIDIQIPIGGKSPGS